MDNGSEINGFLAISKPSGVSSYDCVRALKRALKTGGIGHSGTLDPLASGVMLLGVGRATRYLGLLQGMPKTYRAVITLGGVSDTYDKEGSIQAYENPHQPTREEVEAALRANTGTLQQVPPRYSAIKIAGKPAYAYAREGQELKMAAREVQIYQIDIEDYHWPYLTITCHVGSGTYIRSLAHDVGALLRCGGYIESLERTSVGPIALEQCVDMDDLGRVELSRYLLKPQALFSSFASLTVSQADYTALRQGKRLPFAAGGGQVLLFVEPAAGAAQPSLGGIALLQRGQLQPVTIAPL